jgi:hypothetical protein
MKEERVVARPEPSVSDAENRVIRRKPLDEGPLGYPGRQHIEGVAASSDRCTRDARCGDYVLGDQESCLSEGGSERSNHHLGVACFEFGDALEPRLFQTS